MSIANRERGCSVSTYQGMAAGMPTSSRVAPMSDTVARLVTAAASALAVSYAAEQAAGMRAIGFARIAWEVRDDAVRSAAALAAMNAADAAWDELRPATDAAWRVLVALVGDAAPAWVLPDGTGINAAWARLGAGLVPPRRAHRRMNARAE